MNSKKIIFITAEFPPEPGGIGNHAYHLAKGLREKNHQVSILTEYRNHSFQEEMEFDKQQLFSIKRVQRKKIIFFTYILRIVMAFKLGRQADVVLVSGKFSLWTGAVLKSFFNVPVMAIVHGSELQLKNAYLKKFTDYCLKKMDKCIAVSTYTKSLLPKKAQEKAVVIPNGFEIKPTLLQSPRNTHPSEKLNLITVGNVTQRKGQQNVIKALPALKKIYPQLHYHIVGIPTEKIKLIQLATQLGVMKDITFHGKVNEEDKIGLLSRASIFMMLSEATMTGDVEGFGIAILEANALGIPAIGALGCGIEDAIKEGFSGKLVHAHNEEEITRSAQEIMNDYLSYQKNAKEWSGKFTWEKIIPAYLTIIE